MGLPQLSSPANADARTPPPAPRDGRCPIVSTPQPPADAGPGKDRYARTFDVLELLVGHAGGMTVTEIAKRLELPVSSSHNLLQRMVASEVVSVTEDLRYALGPRAVRLGLRIADELEVRSVARRHLQDLALATGEDVYLAVRLGENVTYVDRVPGSRPVSVEIRLGRELYLHATAVGKLYAALDPSLRPRLEHNDPPALTAHTITDPDTLDAELERIRHTGFAVSREEAVDGIVGLAVPVRDATGRLAAAVHISRLAAGLTDAVETSLIDAARSAASAVERDLGRLDHH